MLASKYLQIIILLILSVSIKAQSTIYQASYETNDHNWQTTGAPKVWQRNSGATPSDETGPKEAFDGKHYFFTEASDARSNKTAHLTSPIINLPAGAALELSFAYHLYGEDMGALSLSVVQSGGGTAQVWSKSGKHDNEWAKATIDLSGYAGTNIQLRFTGQTGPGALSDMAVDAIEITQASPKAQPECEVLITSFPYLESFDTGMGAWNEDSGVNLWRRNSGRTGSAGTGPSTANHGSHYVYTEASAPNYPGRENYLTGPCFQFTGLANATLTFDYHMYGVDMGEIEVQAQPADGGPWQRLWSRKGNYGFEWRQASVNLGALLDGNYRLRLRGRTGTNFKGDAAIDNIQINTAPAPPPGNWTDAIADFPYTESFETSLGGWTQEGPLNIFRRQTGRTTSHRTGPNAAYQGQYYVYTETSGGNTPGKQGWLNGPTFDLSTVTRADFQFNYHAYGIDVNRLQLQATRDGGLNWETVWLQAGEDAAGPLSGSWHAAAVDLSPYTGGLVRLRFVTVTGDNFRGDMAIDNLRLTIPGPNTGLTGRVFFLPAGTAYGHHSPLIGDPVENVSVRLQPENGGPEITATTDYNGVYTITVGTGRVDILPEVAGNNQREGLENDDVVMLQQHILRNQLITDPIGRLAADVNRDGRLTVQDMQELQAVALGNAPAFTSAPNWQLIADHYARRVMNAFHPDEVFAADFWNPAPTDANNDEFPFLGNVNLPQRYLTYAGTDDWVGQLADWRVEAGVAAQCRPSADFILFKTGDVNRSANPHTFEEPGLAPPPNEEDSFAKSTGATKSKQPQQKRLTDDKRRYRVSVFATSATPIYGFQTALRYDPEVITVKRVTPNRSDLYEGDVLPFSDIGNVAEPVVRTFWTSTNTAGRQLSRDQASEADDASEGKLLYRLNITAYANRRVTKAAITIDELDLPTRFFDVHGEEIEGVDVEMFVRKRGDQDAGKSLAEKKTAGEAVEEEGLVVFPNPARGGVQFTFTGSVEGKTLARLIDARGQVVLSHSFNRLGSERQRLPTPGLAPGVYSLELTEADGKPLESTRVVLVQ